VFSALRRQPTEAADPSDAQAAVILLHADDEDASTWHVFADQRAFPLIGRIRSTGAPGSAVTFGRLEPANRHDSATGQVTDYPGVALPATHGVGYCRLSRIGAVLLSKPQRLSPPRFEFRSGIEARS
jgi:hypothetical protein